jgi:ribA/ribD-fused uncharacterized protein
MIKEFQGEDRWLSNFEPCDIEYEGIKFKNVETAYQAAKTLDEDVRRDISLLSPGKAKRAGKVVQMRDDWNEIKLDIMKDFLRQKFSRDPLRKMLLDTGKQEIQEGNFWRDHFWGVDFITGQGENNLGKLIMEVRRELREEEGKY